MYSCFGRAFRVEEALFLVVGLDERDLLVAAAGELEVAQRLRIDGKDAAGRAILRRHVADGGAIGEWKRGDAGAVELNELADDAELAQRLRYGQHEIGRGRAFAQFAGQLVADDLRHQHADGLAEHGGFGLDAADAPAQNAEAVDHGGVRIGADQRVGIGLQLAIHVGGEDYARQVFEIHLVADAHARRHGAEVAECGLAPLEERIAFAIALELEQRVRFVGLRSAELVHLDGVIDHQFRRHQRIDALRIAAERLDGIAHRAEVDDCGDAGEVLHQNAGRHVGDLAARLGLGIPLGQELDVGGGDVHAVFAAQQVFEQDLEAEGQAAQVESARARAQAGERWCRTCCRI